MIPKSYITEWSKTAPWLNNYHVEQDLIIEKALIEIFSHDELKKQLAFRGGTALHKLYLKPQARYSEDIDLVQVESGPIKPILDNIRVQLSFLGDANFKTSSHNNTLFYRFTSENEGIKLKLKIEINTREHFSVIGYRTVDYSIKSEYFSGSCSIKTFTIEELLGTKLRALYQRKKGRDLFDLWYANEKIKLDPTKIIDSFSQYIAHENTSISSKEFIQNMEQKIKDTDFHRDITGLLRRGIEYDTPKAWEIIKELIINKI
jgi:predicted nucleotidyltransferase component of viral defense system